jgi:hypothetical protein
VTTTGLSVTASVQLDINGNGKVQIGPLSAAEVWHPASVHVSVTTANNEAVCNIYVGDNTDQRNFRDATFTGSSGDSSDRVSADIVKVGHYIMAVWTDGDPRATASLSITGTKDIG